MKKLKGVLMAMIILVSMVSIVPQTYIENNTVVVIPCGDEDLPLG